MQACLSMYDLPALRAATDVWWEGLARHLRVADVDEVPTCLTREPLPDWADPGLLLAQTCGYPLTHRLADKVQLLCTPCHAAPGCEGPRYSSAIVVAEGSAASGLEELRGGVCAINERDSHSGFNVLRRMVAPLAGGGPFFGRVIETGSHPASLAAVGTGRADLCAVDAVLHALLARHQPGALAGTRVMGFSRMAPGLPYIAGSAVAPATLESVRRAIHSAFTDKSLSAVREDLLLTGAEDLPLQAYDEIVRMEMEAEHLGYPELR